MNEKTKRFLSRYGKWASGYTDPAPLKKEDAEKALKAYYEFFRAKGKDKA